jgi:hypothetical protein
MHSGTTGWCQIARSPLPNGREGVMPTAVRDSGWQEAHHDCEGRREASQRLEASPKVPLAEAPR